MRKTKAMKPNIGTFALVDYKGKFEIAHDPDSVHPHDFVVGSITRRELIADAANRAAAAAYYGVPAYVGNDTAIRSLFWRLIDRLQ